VDVVGRLCTVSRKVEDVVLALAEREMTRKELLAAADVGQGTLIKIVDWLLKRGFAVEVPVSRYKVVLRLTEKGRRLAALVREIEELVGDP
jgi:DNA-binding MarR family transcriptional regulator